MGQTFSESGVKPIGIYNYKYKLIRFDTFRFDYDTKNVIVFSTSVVVLCVRHSFIASVLCHPSSVIRHLSSVLGHPSSVIRPPSRLLRYFKQFLIPHPSSLFMIRDYYEINPGHSTLHSRRSALSSVIRNRSSVIRPPSSVIRLRTPFFSVSLFYFKYLSNQSNIYLFISLVLIGSVGICPAIGKTINFDSVPMSWRILKYL
jgi:hypothetical protein